MKGAVVKGVLALALFCGYGVATAATDWTGFYAGVNAGYGWGSSDATMSTANAPDSYLSPVEVTSFNDHGMFHFHPSGFTGGIQAGYNTQRLFHNPHFVVGLETEFDAFCLQASGSVTAIYPDDPTFTYTLYQKVRTRWLFTLRPRLGWAFGSWLVYATGGLAVTDLKYKAQFTDSYGTTYNAYEASSKSSIRAGWTVGGGIEHAFARFWTVHLSYLYTHFGHLSSSGTLTNNTFAPNPVFHTANLSANIVRVGVNRYF